MSGLDTRFDFDLFVIGAGSGGVRAARMSASYGARVGICEDRYLGGTCVNVGCIPKKLLVYGSHFRGECEDAAGYGWSFSPPTLDWERMIANKNKEIARLNDVYRDLLSGAGVHLVEGRGRLVDAHTVQVGQQRFRSRYILIATGGWPVLPELPGKEHILTSNEIFYLKRFPSRIVIVGGGYIAVEFAGIFNGFGSEVTQLYRGELFLRGFDGDQRKVLAEEMRRLGVDLRFGVNVTRIKKTGAGLLLTLDDGSQLESDALLYATGRRPNNADLGLEVLGVRLSAKGAVEVNACYQSSVPSIYALGDVTDKIQLTPVALAEGMVLAAHLFAGGKGWVDYGNVPTAVFSQPPLGSVGLTEEQARAAHEVRIYRSQFTPLKHTLTGSGEKTMLKIIVDKTSDKVLGVHMVGAEAGEIIQGLAIAMKCGVTKAQLDATIGIHPTTAEELVSMYTPQPESPPARAD